MDQQKLDVGALFRDAAVEMRSAYNQSSHLRHRGDSGTAREDALRDFLKRYLPGTASVIDGSSEVVDTEGNWSHQIDVAVVVPSVPPLYTSGSVQILPIETLRGLFEVKSTLTWGGLREDLEKLASVKRMERVALKRDLIGISFTAYGRQWDYPPVFGHVFAFDCANPVGLIPKVMEWAADRPLRELPDSIWILGKGGLIWHDPATGRNHITPEAGCHLTFIENEAYDTLFMMMAMVNDLYNGSFGGRFDFKMFLSATGAPLGVSSSISRLTLPVTHGDLGSGNSAISWGEFHG